MTPRFDSGDTAWMLSASALALMTIIPGLALFYAGMVRKKNVLSTMAQTFSATCVVTLMWMIAGYSIALTTNPDPHMQNWFGGFSDLFLRRLVLAGVSAQAPTIPESSYLLFQMTFAIIASALIAGAFADRMKFSSFLWFIALWLLLVYAPIAHWVWGHGWLHEMGMLDFAGGTVVHLNAGTAGLVTALVMGKRIGLGSANMAPHNLVLSVSGGALLWVGWFGLNAGSAGAANAQAGMAALVTQIAAAAACLSWMVSEWIVASRPSVLGMITGAVAGLVAISPASGYVEPGGAFITGVVAGVLCYVASVWMKKALRYDDALDSWGVHGVGGALGALLTGVFASHTINGGAHGWLRDGNFHQLGVQIIAVAAVLAYCAAATFVILKVLDLVIGLRVSEDVEVEGLDINLHGETVRD